MTSDRHHIPIPPDEPRPAPVEEPPDAPATEPDAPVREPDPAGPQRLRGRVLHMRKPRQPVAASDFPLYLRATGSSRLY